MSENLKEIEQALLGSCLQNNDIAEQVKMKLDETFFYSSLAKNLFNILKKCQKWR